MNIEVLGRKDNSRKCRTVVDSDTTARKRPSPPYTFATEGYAKIIWQCWVRPTLSKILRIKKK
jgi:hypothetical protein